MANNGNQTKNTPENNRGEFSDNERFALINPFWLGRRDSNPRMSAPKTDALPLGDAPAL